jgi:hypothetical protein
MERASLTGAILFKLGLAALFCRYRSLPTGLSENAPHIETQGGISTASDSERDSI